MTGERRSSSKLIISHQRWVLVVDDDGESADQIRKALVGLGVHVVVASSAHDAGRKLSSQRFHCVLVHMRLDRDGGEKVLQMLHEERKGPNARVPALALAPGIDKDLLLRIRHKVAGIVLDPMDIQTLIGRVGSILGSKPPVPQPAS